MKYFVLLFLILTFEAQPGVKDSIAYIDGLLKNGDKKIAILLIDMQSAFIENFDPQEFETVWHSQLQLLSRYQDDDRVLFFDINMESAGDTLPPLIKALKTKETYRLFIKKGLNPFDSVDATPSKPINESLQKTLSSRGVTDVMPVGCYDASCVKAATKEAIALGFNVVVDRDMNIKYHMRMMGQAGVSKEQLNSDTGKIWLKLQQTYPQQLKVIESGTGRKPCS